MLFVELSEEVSYINILESIFVYFSLKRIYYNINAKHNVVLRLTNRIKAFVLFEVRIRTMISILFP